MALRIERPMVTVLILGAEAAADYQMDLDIQKFDIEPAFEPGMKVTVEWEEGDRRCAAGTYEAVVRSVTGTKVDVLYTGAERDHVSTHDVLLGWVIRRAE